MWSALWLWLGRAATEGSYLFPGLQVMCCGNCWGLMRGWKVMWEDGECDCCCWDLLQLWLEKYLPVILEYILRRIDNIRFCGVLMCCCNFGFHLCELFLSFFSGNANTASEGTHSSWQHDQQWHYYVLYNGKCGLLRHFKKHFNVFFLKWESFSYKSASTF